MLFGAIIFAVAIVLWAVIEWAAILGLFGALTGERFGRCQRCHHLGVTTDGEIHPGGCPERPITHLIHANRSLTSDRIHQLRIHPGHH